MNSCRYSANIVHLYDEKIFNKNISSKTEALMESNQDTYVCKKGLNIV